MHNPQHLPAVKAHLLLAGLTVLPCFVHVPYSVSIVLHAALTVYVGAWRSLRGEDGGPTESMTNSDAMRFPLVGSCVLFGLFLCFKFLPKELVNLLLAGYITIIGAVVVVGAVLPFAERLFSPKQRDRVLRFGTLPRIPFLVKEPTPLELSLPEAVLGVPALAIGAWYFATKNWLANNVLGLALSIVGVEAMSLGSMQTAGILLIGLFFYDIFWVFCTPVMVSVAKNFEAPIKLLFPRSSLRAAAAAGEKAQFAMLGLGDIVLPGLFVALCLRFDAERKFRSTYFQTVFWAYCGGVGTTIFVMNFFKAAQPALLYIVPCTLGAVAAHAALRGELKAVYEWQEAERPAAAADGADGAAGSGSGSKKKE
ncbi:signal peptide peptidase-like [Raphidocelis subcapitata]|uniref:Signal peptide peptidase-like n=1 Tax=Raphidocelis subcapitata TaxID=307507 RepID=A0A2V0PD79_9CHLO|nr:signal peptide peptidase-like [Raphidocelis subcapitata]|eukprot:GBF97469.1 signal peptide peptidase-like [Raphidocelis subcapitata]